MGYRSQVACCISVDVVRHEDEGGKVSFTYDKDKFKQMIGFIKLSRFYELWTANESDQDAIGWDNGNFLLYGADWKWYPDYADVRAFHEMFNALSDVEGISGYFLRVGEESGDVEEEEFGDDPCYDYFHHFTAMDFTGEAYLGKRNTDEEGQNAQDASVAG
jgi:hypothetical protein